MTFDITDILKAIIALVVALVGTVCVPWLKAKYSAEQLSKLLFWVDLGTRAAEQLFTAAQGEAKKQYVLNFLEENGIKFDEDVVNNMIEAEVLKLHTELYGAEKDE